MLAIEGFPFGLQEGNAAFVHLQDGLVGCVAGIGVGAHKHRRLDALLQQVSYAPGQDKLIILGDFLLKGKLNLSTLHRIMELAALPEVTVLRGNCDDILEIIARNYPSGGMENFLRRSGFCKEVWTKAGMTTWDDLTTDQLLQKLEETIPQELAFLHSLPDILVTERAIFVHGGIYDGRQDHFETLDSFDCRKCDEFWLTDYAFDKYLVVGHWPVSSYPRPFADHKPVLDHQRRIISIDGGCSAQFSGQLNALIIQGDELEDASCAFADALPKVQALEAQESNGSTRRMYWGNDYVDVLSKTDDAYRVRQQLQALRPCQDFHTRKSPREYSFFRIPPFALFDYYNTNRTFFTSIRRHFSPFAIKKIEPRKISNPIFVEIE